jgi:hypothetical protein
MRMQKPNIGPSANLEDHTIDLQFGISTLGSKGPLVDYSRIV